MTADNTSCTTQHTKHARQHRSLTRLLCLYVVILTVYETQLTLILYLCPRQHLLTLWTVLNKYIHNVFNRNKGVKMKLMWGLEWFMCPSSAPIPARQTQTQSVSVLWHVLHVFVLMSSNSWCDAGLCMKVEFVMDYMFNPSTKLYL